MAVGDKIFVMKDEYSGEVFVSVHATLEGAVQEGKATVAEWFDWADDKNSKIAAFNDAIDALVKVVDISDAHIVVPYDDGGSINIAQREILP